MLVRHAHREDVRSIAQLSAELAEVLRRVGNPVGAALGAAEIAEKGFGHTPAFTVLVAEVEGAVVGYLLYHPAYDPDLGGRVVTVVDLYVTDRFRKRGIGRALMDAALDHSRQVGAPPSCGGFERPIAMPWRSTSGWVHPRPPGSCV